MHTNWLLLFSWPFLFCAASAFQYQTFYPEFQSELRNILLDNCSEPYDPYIEENIQVRNKWCYPTLNCILGHALESTKANLGSASVLLGLTPSMLSLLGSNTAELSLLSSQRPLLSLLLAAGSPALNPIRAFTYENPLFALTSQSGRASLPTLTRLTSRLCVGVELVFAIAAVANVALASYELGSNTIYIAGCGSNFDPLIWTFIAVAIHLIGMFTFSLQAQVKWSVASMALDAPGEQQPPQEVAARTESKPWRNIKGRRVADWLDAEFTPCMTHTNLSFSWRNETYLFIFMSWVTSVVTICHLLYGTSVFSSLLFVGVTDAWRVIGRFMASAVVCRVIVMYELAGMREVAVLDIGDSSGLA